MHRTPRGRVDAPRVRGSAEPGSSGALAQEVGQAPWAAMDAGWGATGTCNASTRSCHVVPRDPVPGGRVDPGVGNSRTRAGAPRCRRLVVDWSSRRAVGKEYTASRATVARPGRAGNRSAWTAPCACASCAPTPPRWELGHGPHPAQGPGPTPATGKQQHRTAPAELPLRRPSR